MAVFSRDSRRDGVFVGAARNGFRPFPLILVLCLALIVTAANGRAHAGTLVQLNYANFGSVQIDLFDDLMNSLTTTANQVDTVENFLNNYVGTGRYSNTMVHRSVSNFVIQGGAFHPDGSQITLSSAIDLQYSRANTRGTIAMARQGDGGVFANTKTATSQWFINTANNTTSLAPHTSGGPADPARFGYAVFGWVVGPGMSVVDAIAAVEKFDYDHDDPTDPQNAQVQALLNNFAASIGLQNRHTFNEWPLQNFTTEQYFGLEENPIPHAIVLTSVSVVRTHASYQNPYAKLDVNNDNALTAADARDIISELLTNGSHTLNTPFSGKSYIDPDGNGKVTVTDARDVISALLSGSGLQVTPLVSPLASPASADAMSSPDAMFMVVPEPSSLTLGAICALALSACALRRVQARRRGLGQAG